MVSDFIMGYDHLAEDSKWKEFGEHSYRTRTMFAPAVSLWEADAYDADNPDLGTLGWFSQVRSQAIKKIYDRTFVSEIDCL
jgi:hypothetical protein